MGNAGNALEFSVRFWGISERILGNDIIFRYWRMLKKIPENVEKILENVSKHSEYYLRRFRGNVQEDSWEYSRRLDAL